jgi:hypothetical protein
MDNTLLFGVTYLVNLSELHDKRSCQTMGFLFCSLDKESHDPNLLLKVCYVLLQGKPL